MDYTSSTYLLFWLIIHSFTIFVATFSQNALSCSTKRMVGWNWSSSSSIHRNDTAEKMTLTTISDYFDKVIEKLLAVFHLPVIVTLVNGNYKPLLRSIHIFN